LARGAICLSVCRRGVGRDCMESLVCGKDSRTWSKS